MTNRDSPDGTSQFARAVVTETYPLTEKQWIKLNQPPGVSTLETEKKTQLI